MRKTTVFSMFALLLLAGIANAGKTITLEDKMNAGPFSDFHRHSVVEEYLPDEVMIKFRENVTTKDLAMFQDQMGIQAASRQEAIVAFYQGYGVQLKRKTSLGWDRVKLKEGQTVKGVIEQIEKNPLVEKAEPNYRVYASALSTTYTATGTIDDSFYADGSSMWYFNRTKADQAFNANFGFSGTGDVIVAVVDTGVDLSHPDLSGRLVNGWDFANGDSDPDDDNEWIGTTHIQGHGTHAAGLIAATIDNTVGVAGTGWKSQIKIMPVKVLDSSAGGSLSDLANGINYAVTNGAHIINMSLSAAATSSELASAVTNSNNNGILLVAAAGNDDVNLATAPRYPAVYSTVMSIGAVSSDDNITIYSNYSSPAGYIDCVAPGGSLSSIVSGVLFDNDYGVTSTARNDSYSAVDGTSFAAPQVAGLAAMLKLQNPLRTHTELRTIINNYCDTVGNGDTQLYGAGRINVLEALGIYQTPTASPTSTVTMTATATHTITKTSSPTSTFTFSPTATMTATESATHTITTTMSPSPSRTITPSITMTHTPSPTHTSSPTFTTTPTPVYSPTETAIMTMTSTITFTSTPTVTATEDKSANVDLKSKKALAYPNPAENEVTFIMHLAESSNVTIHIYNVRGEQVAKLNQGALNGNGQTMFWNCSDVAPGLYIAKVMINEKIEEVLKIAIAK